MIADSTLPLHTAGPYVAAAYIVFVALILLYVAIMAGKLSRIERELDDLTELAARLRARLSGSGEGEEL
jgi:CcmD family protein